jgi:hypothetical protein
MHISFKTTRFLCFFLVFTSCITEFVPEVDEKNDVLVVEGMVTDQYRSNIIKLSKALSLGKKLTSNPVTKATVTITDEMGVVTTLKETSKGVYSTDSTKFCGHVGGKYSLNIKVLDATYSSDFIEMKPVPQINSLYYEKVLISTNKEGCKIYLDTYDPNKECLFFRWDYVETYEYNLPYSVPNRKCWVTDKSDKIMVKNTSIYNQSRVSMYPITYITNESEKLIDRYSILVNQYSLNEDEYNFWDRLQNITQNVGSLYDITPMSIPGNVKCTSNTAEKVLGYFSVSAVSQKRIFIKDRFFGIPNFFSQCIADTIYGKLPSGLNSSYWVLIEENSMKIITYSKDCADCTTKGTNIRPDFWPKNDY